MQILAILVHTLLLGATGKTVTAPPAPGAIPAHCGPTVDKTRGSTIGPMKLGDQPPAAQVLTVFRRDADGCPKPVVLRKGIGANPERALPIARGGTVQPVR